MFKSALLSLQLSHIFYFLGAIYAWKKGYKEFSLFLALMIFVSMVTHTLEGSKYETDSLDIFEKLMVIAVSLYGIILFGKYFDELNWVIVFFSLGLWGFAHAAYRLSEEKRVNFWDYIIAHSIWHLGTGIVLLRALKAAPNLNE